MQVFKESLMSGDPRTWYWGETELDPQQLIERQLVGISQWAEEARAAIAAHASHDNPIILEGEQGTGKRFLARLIHRCSARAAGPFVAISCQHVSSESIEAALFGSIRSQQSGRLYVQNGMVESAQGGTIYIDGLTSFAPSLQVKIARLINHREFRRLGGDSFEPVDTRIILGSEQPVAAPAGERSALEKFSICVSDKLTLLPLRRRTADIDPLSRHFIKTFCGQLGKEERELAPDTIAVLQRQEWPGNVGELKRVINHMVQQSRPPRLDCSFLPAHLLEGPPAPAESIPESGIDLNKEVREYEIALLCSALKESQGVQFKAARMLNIKPTTLNTKLKQYGIDSRSFKR